MTGLLLCLTSAVAEERILSFHSEVSIAADALLEVRESIRVRAEGKNIQRGIYRDFPTDYTDQYGNAYKVDFELLAVTRDGVVEQSRLERRGNGLRIYIGSEDRVLAPGRYNYLLHYSTRRQLGFFEDHDELYWNVTGNGWAFPIDNASAVVTLPEPVAASSLAIQGFTGRAGSKAQNYRADVSAGKFSIASSGELAPQEGLTLVASWPKGVVHEPDRWQRFGYLLKDNRGLLLAFVALLLCGIYLHTVWRRYGRDPEPGVIYPRYDPPAGYSPASARYISRMGYDGPVMAAAILNLAVKGYVGITEVDGDFSLLRKASTEPLSPGESALLSLIFVGGPQIELDRKNHSALGRAKDAHKKALQRDYRNIYFRLNTAKIAPSALGTIALGVVIGIMQAFTPLAAAVMLLNALLHALYIYLLRAPTARGRLLLDQLMGFKLYLEVAEQEDLNRAHPPQKTPELFERFLPYAVALGVEQAWADKFSDVFNKLDEPGKQGYRPGWYSGHFDPARLGSFASTVGSGFSSAISSAATPPGSSSGGSGGSSGGGGGGGGGGGW